MTGELGKVVSWGWQRGLQSKVTRIDRGKNGFWEEISHLRKEANDAGGGDHEKKLFDQRGKCYGSRKSVPGVREETGKRGCSCR